MKGQEIKRRMNGVKETVKITKAMQMIAVSKMYKTQQNFENSKKFLSEVKNSVSLLMNPSVSRHPYCVNHKGDRIAYIVISGDKGFCGDYNLLVLEAALKDMQDKNVVKIFAIGKTAADFFNKRGMDVSNLYVHLLQNPLPFDAQVVTDDMLQGFVEEKIDKLYLVYTETHSLSVQQVAIKKMLPIDFVPQDKDTPIINKDKDISPFLYQYVWSEILHALNSASLAINYKTMITMQQATSNGMDMLKQLQLDYNHKRQENITTELLDIATSQQGKRI